MSGSPLITGATGFAGGHLLEFLSSTGTPVTAWGHARGRPIPAAAHTTQWDAVDLEDADAVIAAIDRARPSVVYHCAGIADEHGSWNQAGRTLRVNALGTHHLLHALRATHQSPRVVIVSSALVYRQATTRIDESSTVGPASPYGVSKVAQEMVAGASALPVLIARPFNHAGPRQSDGYVTSSFARQIAEIEAGMTEAVLRVGNLESQRDITDVRDTVRGYVALGERGTPGRPYNICCGRAYRVRELMEFLLSRARVAIRVEQDPSRLRPSDNPIVLGSFERIHREAGWSPSIPIERTLDDLLDYWRDRIRTAGALRA